VGRRNADVRLNCAVFLGTERTPQETAQNARLGNYPGNEFKDSKTKNGLSRWVNIDSAPESHGTHTEELGTESKARLKAQIDVGCANNSAKEASDEYSPDKDQMKPPTSGDGGQT